MGKGQLKQVALERSSLWPLAGEVSALTRRHQLLLCIFHSQKGQFLGGDGEDAETP